VQRSLLWCGYAGSSLEVKIETVNIDAIEIETEVDSDDITEYLHGDLPTTGMFGYMMVHSCYLFAVLHMYGIYGLICTVLS